MSNRLEFGSTAVVLGMGCGIWCVYATIVLSIVFWFVTGLLWILESNGAVPVGTSANVADFYPWVPSNVWETPFKS